VILNEGQGFNRDIYWKRGKLYLETGEAQKAIDDFTAALQLGSLCEKDYQFRARAFRLAGNTQAAEADEERARQALQDQKRYTGSEYCHYHKN
jgi:tetratricopeptide (TPR) repeat protein